MLQDISSIPKQAAPSKPPSTGEPCPGIQGQHQGQPSIDSGSEADASAATELITHTHPQAELPFGGLEASLTDEMVLGPINTLADTQHVKPLIREQVYRVNTQSDSFDHWLGDFPMSAFDQANFLHSWSPFTTHLSLLPGTDSMSVTQLPLSQTDQTLDGWAMGNSIPFQAKAVQRLEMDQVKTYSTASSFEPPSIVGNRFTGPFARARRHWHVRRHQPNTDPWITLLGDGMVTQPPTNLQPRSETFLQRRRFDEAARARLKDAIRAHRNLSQSFSVQASSPNYNSFSSTSCTLQSDDGDMPPAGLLDIALDVYFSRCDPTIPIIHHATFSAKAAPTCLLISLVLTGFHMLGTRGAVSYVRKLLPTLLSMVLRQLETECTASFQDAEWLATMSAAVVVSNLAILLQHQGNEEDYRTEFFVTTVLSTAQHVGLFSPRECQLYYENISDTQNVDDRWRKWSRIESAKRVTIALTDLNLSFSALYGRRPVVQVDDVSIISPRGDDAFWAETSLIWSDIMQGEYLEHTPAISLRSCDITGGGWNIQTVCGILTLVQSSLWEFYHSFHTLKDVVQPETHFLPWQACQRSNEKDLVKLTLSLSPHCIGSSDSIKVNDALSWHLSCLMLAANCQTFATALSFANNEAAILALEDIKSWAKSPTARRACLHAGEIFAILHHRRMKEPVTLHSVCSALWAGIVMGLYYFNVPVESGSSECDIDLLSSFDWQALGATGFTCGQQQSREDLGVGGASATALEFIAAGGTPRISGDYHPGGHVTARRIFSHFADLIDGLGAWRLPLLSQVLRAASEDLMDMDRHP